MRLFPLFRFDLIDNALADSRLVAWGHWLGECGRPFGIQSFGLYHEQELVSVATSASTVVDRCADFDRQEVVELARLCSHPEHTDLTRVMLRLWRKSAPDAWPYWRPRALVSYANAVRHTGNIYRFDGWRKHSDVPGGKKVNYGRPKTIDPKSVWVFDLASDASAALSPAPPPAPAPRGQDGGA